MATIKFEPRGWQKIVFTDPSRFKVMIIHRRAGKSTLACYKMVIDAIQSKKNLPQYAYLAPELGQSDLIIFRQMTHIVQDIPGVIVRESKKEISFTHNNAIIKVLGLKDPNRIRGLYLDGVIVDEFGQTPAGAWGEVLLPALTDRTGWALLLGTPQGRDPLYEIYERAKNDITGLWSAYKLTVEDTDVFDEATKDQLRDNMTPAQYLQEMMVEFNADASNKYYLDQITRAYEQERIGIFPYDPKYPVYVAYDLGRDGTAATFFQKKPEKIIIIDYYEKENCTLTELLNVVSGKGYIYKTHILPHDANHKRINADYSIYDQFRNHGHHVHLLQRTEVQQGIALVQNTLPKVLLNRNACKRLIECLQNYQAKIDKQTGLMTSQPLHDQFSHGADSFRYAMIGANQLDRGYETDPWRKKTNNLTIDFDPLD